MTTETPVQKPQQTVTKNIYRNASEAVYGFGFIGALIYYVQHAPTFVLAIFGILKALVWPGLVVYRLLEFLKM